MDFPLVIVTVTENGAAPAQMETQITRPIEDALAGLSNVRDISSNITQGVSTTTVAFAIGEDLQNKTDEVRSAIDRVRATLPRDIDEPLVTRLEVGNTPILTYAVAAPNMSDVQLSWFIDDTIVRALRTGKGVAQVARVGGVNREIDVLLDIDRLAAYGITAADVNDAISSMQVDAPGGRVEIGGREQMLRVQGAVDTLQRLRELTVPTANGQFVKLTNVADVGDGAAEMRGFARLNSRPVVGFQVSKTRDASDVSVDEFVVAAIAQLQRDHPDAHFTQIFSSVDDTRKGFRSTQHVLLEGMLLAAIVVFFFLRNWRATLITAVAMPISLIPTFAVIQAFGFSLNMVTLLALTLVIGILVDDAIVEIENIEKRIEAGSRPYHAALLGADAIGLAVVATTLAIVAVFTPVSFMSGPIGVFFREFGLTVSVAVLFSLLVARLLTPLLAAYFLRPAPPRAPKPFVGCYRRALDWTLDHRVIACALAGLLFLASLALTILLPKGFQPTDDPDFMFINVQAPPGSTAADMERTVQTITAALLHQAEVTNVFAQVGSTASAGLIAGGGTADLRQGTVTVLLDQKRKATGAQLRARINDELRAIPDARLNFIDFQGSAGFRQTLTGDDPKALQAAATQLEREMRSLPMLANPQPVAPPTAPEVVIRPRSDEAAQRGISTLALARILRVATAGDIDANVAKLEEGERRIPIRVRLPTRDRADLERMLNLRIRMPGGATTTLGSITDIEFQAGPGQIQRLNRRRQMTVEAEIKDAELGQVVSAVNALPIMRNLPDGVRPSAVGDAKNMEDLFGSFALALFAGIAMIFAVLILLFRSFFKPIVILSVAPLAITGAFLGLLICGLTLQLASLIGLLMLLGLATKNSILVVDYAVELERAGATQREALLEACHKRARPIVMTTMAMATGMLPSALASGAGDGFSQTLAVTVIGGLITSTLLSLLLVPAVYELVDDFEQWLQPKLTRFVTPREAPEDVAVDTTASDAQSPSILYRPLDPREG